LPNRDPKVLHGYMLREAPILDTYQIQKGNGNKYPIRITKKKINRDMAGEG
jgi:hypothetical protein